MMKDSSSAPTSPEKREAGLVSDELPNTRVLGPRLSPSLETKAQGLRMLRQQQKNGFHLPHFDLEDEDGDVHGEGSKDEEKKEGGTYIHNIIFSGIGLVSDGYNAQVISFALLLLSKIHSREELTSKIKTRISAAYYVGIVMGALLFGSLIDGISRKTGVVLATAVLVVGVGFSSVSGVNTSPSGLFWMLTISRGILGVGAGGEYPVCTTGATEASDENRTVQKRRGMLVALVGNFAVDIGLVLGGVVPLIILAVYGYRANTPATQVNGLEAAWRIAVGLGAAIPIAVFYWRYKMVTSTAFSKNSKRSLGKVSTARFYALVLRRYWRSLSGACLCWFLYDFVSYPASLLATPFIAGLSSSSSHSGTPTSTSLMHAVGYGSLINLFTLPGCLIGSLLLDRAGRKTTQMAGFFAQAIIGAVLGGVLHRIKSNLCAFVLLYGAFVACAEAGPGVATILISAEVAPTAVRGHFVGLAAAFGKAGAAIGAVCFSALQAQFSDEMAGQQAVFLVAAGFSLVGALATFLLIPAQLEKRSLEEEDKQFRKYLEEHGIVQDVFCKGAAETVHEVKEEKCDEDLKDQDDKVQDKLFRG